MTNASDPSSSPSPVDSDDRAEQGEQWQHHEPREQALVNEASRKPGGVQRSTAIDPVDDRTE